MIPGFAIIGWLDAIPWITLTTILHGITFAWVFLHIVQHRREPVSSLLWIVVCWSLPIIGFFLYLMFGIYKVPRKTWMKEKSNRQFQSEREAREAESLPMYYWKSVRESVTGGPISPKAHEVDLALERVVGDHPLLGGNQIAPLTTGDEAFPRMLEAIRNARHHIHLQTFILGNDATGRLFLDALAEKAREGVTVRLLFDRFGSTHAVLGGLVRRYRRIPNFHIAGWSQARLLKRQFQLNLRNHRKALIVDGVDAFAGGINLHDAQTSRSGKPAIRDYHFHMAGPIAHEIQYTFLRDWYFMTDESPEELLKAEHFPDITGQGPVAIRMVNGSPATELDELCDAIFTCIVMAHREILAVTPYFIPSSDIIRALRIAALSGVEVRIIVPAANNHVYAGLAGRALYDELMSAGVKIYERNPPFMHAKALIIDDEVAMVGTANLDVRSLRLNYETNLAVYDETFINKLKRIMLEDLAESTEMNLNAWRNRPAIHKVAENVCHLFTPIL